MLCGNNLVNYRLCFWLYSRYFMCAVMLHSDSWALWCCEDGETVKSKQICTLGPEFCLLFGERFSDESGFTGVLVLRSVKADI